MKSRWALCARRYSTRCQLMHYVQVYLKKTIQTLASITKYRLLTKNCVFFSLPTLLCSSCRPLLMSNCFVLQLYMIIVDTILVPHRPSCRSWSYNVRPQHQFSVRSTNGTYNLSFPLHISLYIYFLNVLEFNILPYFLFQHLKTTKLPFLLELNDLLKDRK
uniref:Uncharacterized protein n=1 Tax=Cacopsylla melanoneura TaxID=428564 RepID=A0A8D8T861_9HEMI